jgi:hypothetical protein
MIATYVKLPIHKKDLILETLLICPHCNVEQRATMPVSGMKMAHDCRFCNETMIAKEGSCCVFCSYGITKCPDTQQKELISVSLK